MNAQPPDGVSPERSGWREEALSRRHRDWGLACKMVDLDWFAVEYVVRDGAAHPVLVVDYKQAAAAWPPDPRDWNAEALGRFYHADGRQIAMVFVRYWRQPWTFLVRPGNAEARRILSDSWVMSERKYVRWLYRVRNIEMPAAVGDRLSSDLPLGFVEGRVDEVA